LRANWASDTPLEIAEGLVEGDAQAKVGRDLAHPARRLVAKQQVVLEDLDGVEPGGGGGRQLVAQSCRSRKPSAIDRRMPSSRS